MFNMLVTVLNALLFMFDCLFFMLMASGVVCKMMREGSGYMTNIVIRGLYGVWEALPEWTCVFVNYICLVLGGLGLMSRVFANGPGDWGSIIKWYLMPPCLALSIIRYISRVKWSNPRNGVVPSPTPWCNSYWKGSL